MKKTILILVFLSTYQFSWAQQDLNNYKYVIVPKHFDFQKAPDSYKINSLTKFLVAKKGFQTIFEDEVYPNELISNQCLALKINLLKESNFMRTKIKIVFTNCQNKTVYESGVGVSKLKEYNKLYPQAIRRAFQTFDDFQYSYTPKKEVVVKEMPLVLEVLKPTEKPSTKPTVVVKEVKKVQTVEKKANIVKQEDPIVGLYSSDDMIYEIAAFQNYYIFSKRIVDGNSFQTKPLGFIYKTSKKGNYLIKSTDTLTGYLLDEGHFIIDEIGADGIVKSTTYTKINN